MLAETDLIDDIKRAPDDALSASVPIDSVCSVGMQNEALILTEDCLACSATIHARLTDHGRRALRALGSFEISAEYRSSFPRRPRRDCHGFRRFNPDT